MDDHPGQQVNWWRWFGWAITALALFFVARWLISLDQRVWRNLRYLNILWLAGSLLVFQVWFLMRFIAWEMIVKRHGSETQRHVTLRVWTLSELARYVPGNLWSFASKYRGSVSNGTTSSGALQALAIEAFSQLSGAALIGVLLYDAERLWWIALILVAVFPYMIPVVITLLSRWKKWGQAASISVTESLGLLLWYAAVWFVFGIATAMIYHSFPGILSVSLFWLIGVNVAAWLIGYLSIVTPMGLGVREVAFVKLSAAVIPNALASLISLITRVWFVLSEVLFLTLVLIWSASKRR